MYADVGRQFPTLVAGSQRLMFPPPAVCPPHSRACGMSCIKTRNNKTVTNSALGENKQPLEDSPLHLCSFPTEGNGHPNDNLCTLEVMPADLFQDPLVDLEPQSLQSHVLHLETLVGERHRWDGLWHVRPSGMTRLIATILLMFARLKTSYD